MFARKFVLLTILEAKISGVHHLVQKRDTTCKSMKAFEEFVLRWLCIVMHLLCLKEKLFAHRSTITNKFGVLHLYPTSFSVWQTLDVPSLGPACISHLRHLITGPRYYLPSSSHPNLPV